MKEITVYGRKCALPIKLTISDGDGEVIGIWTTDEPEDDGVMLGFAETCGQGLESKLVCYAIEQREREAAEKDGGK